MKQTNERLCALAQKGDATALDGLIDNNKSASWAFSCSAADCKIPNRPLRSCSSASGVAPFMPETLSNIASVNCSAVIVGCCTSCPLVNSVNIFSATFLLMASCSA